MDRPFTVYFDTNFFVQLCKVDDVLARKVISELNSLKVRHVLSNMIMWELLSSGDRTDRDKILYERVNAFELQPYRTDNFSEWESLLIAGQQRVALASLYKLLDDMTTEAESWSILARQHSHSGQKLEGSTHSEEYEAERAIALKQARELLPLLSQTLDFVKESFPDTAQSLPETPNPESIKIPDNPSPQDLKAISTYIFDLIGETKLKKLEQENQLTDSVTSSEDRAQQVALGQADAWTRKKLANTLRDAKHMDLFVSHSNEIDLLQIDRPQWNLIKNTPMHYLVEVGLVDRCFYATSIQDIVETVSRLKKKQ
jgi:hypothetical protein